MLTHERETSNAVERAIGLIGEQFRLEAMVGTREEAENLRDSFIETETDYFQTLLHLSLEGIMDEIEFTDEEEDNE